MLETEGRYESQLLKWKFYNGIDFERDWLKGVSFSAKKTQTCQFLNEKLYMSDSEREFQFKKLRFESFFSVKTKYFAFFVPF